MSLGAGKQKKVVTFKNFSVFILLLDLLFFSLHLVPFYALMMRWNATVIAVPMLLLRASTDKFHTYEHRRKLQRCTDTGSIVFETKLSSLSARKRPRRSNKHANGPSICLALYDGGVWLSALSKQHSTWTCLFLLRTISWRTSCTEAANTNFWVTELAGLEHGEQKCLNSNLNSAWNSELSFELA